VTDYAYIHVTNTPINYGDDGFRRDVLIVSHFVADNPSAPAATARREYADISEASYRRLKRVRGLRESFRSPFLLGDDPALAIHAHYEVAR